MPANRLIVVFIIHAEIAMNKARSHSSVLNILHISHQRVFSHIPNARLYVMRRCQLQRMQAYLYARLLSNASQKILFGCEKFCA